MKQQDSDKKKPQGGNAAKTTVQNKQETGKDKTADKVVEKNKAVQKNEADGENKVAEKDKAVAANNKKQSENKKQPEGKKQLEGKKQPEGKKQSEGKKQQEEKQQSESKKQQGEKKPSEEKKQQGEKKQPEDKKQQTTKKQPQKPADGKKAEPQKPETKKKNASGEDTEHDAEYNKDIPAEGEIRTVHGQRVGLEPRKEKDEGNKFDTTKEKIAYWWDYHKWTTGVAVGIAICVIMLIRSIIIEMKPPIIYIAMMNAQMDSPGDATYGDDYGNQRGLNPKSGRITLDTDFIHPEEITDEYLKNDTVIASIQRFATAVTTGNIDVAITNPWVLHEYMENDIFCDLRSVYTEAELSQLEGLLIYEKNTAGETVPVGIVINGHRDIDTFYQEGQTIVVGIPRDSSRKERAKDFIAWMFEG